MARTLRTVATTSLAVAAVGAGVLGLAAPASADPVSGFRTYAGVGSDTTQDVTNALAGDITGVTGVTKLIGSYDAFNTNATIQTKAGGNSFPRPAGSGAGVQALSYSLTGKPYQGVDITGQVDFARSSSGPSGTGTDLTYVPFARDAVTYAYRGAAGTVGKLTTAQLKTIFSANTLTTINGVKIRGVLPQSASGTRKFFLSAIGVTTIGTSVLQTSSPENNGSIFTGANQVAPFSAAQWVAQKNGVVADTTGTASLGAPNGKPAVGVNATTNKLAPVASFYNAAPFGRYVYNVIPTSALDTPTTSVARVFVGSTAPFCSARALTIVRQYGFSAIASSAPVACGGTAITGPFTP